MGRMSSSSIDRSEQAALSACPKECDCVIAVKNGNVSVPKNLAYLLGTDPQKSITSAGADSKFKQLETDRAALIAIFEEKKKLTDVTNCPVSQRITYLGGEKGCLTDLPIAKIVDKSWGKSVAELAKTAAYYSIAASENCKIAKIGIASGNMGFLASKAEQSALSSCPKDCDCITIVRNGNVLLPKNLALVINKEITKPQDIAEIDSKLKRIELDTLESLERQRQQNNKLKEINTKIEEEKLLEIAKIQDKKRLDEIAANKEIEQLALATKLKEQNKLLEEAKLKDQIQAMRDAKRQEDARLEKYLAEREAVRLADLKKLKDTEEKEKTKLQELLRIQENVRNEQAERQRDRELLVLLSQELAKLKAEAAKNPQLNSQIDRDISPNKALSPDLQLFANRKALVIGNDGYKFVPQLSNAKEDARSIAENLTDVGYKVTLKFDQSEKEMKASLRSFKSQLEPGDEVAFFYAGHGVQLANSNYLVPIDVAGEGEEQIKDEAISLQRILDDMTDKKVKFTLAMIDACRDNPFKSIGRSVAGGSRGLAPTTAATGQMIVFSAGTGQQALDKLGPNDKDKNGLFTRLFIKEMRKPGIPIDRLVRNVRNDVVNTAKSIGHEQVPAIYDQVVGEFYFKK